MFFNRNVKKMKKTKNIARVMKERLVPVGVKKGNKFSYNICFQSVKSSIKLRPVHASVIFGDSVTFIVIYIIIMIIY
jgi:hypothetical protein